MSHPTTPDPSAVVRGAQIIENELRRSRIPPAPAECLQRILAMPDAAQEVLAQAAADDYPAAAGVAVALVDAYRRECAALGKPEVTR